MTTPADEINWARTPCARLFAQGVDYWFGPEAIDRATVEETPSEQQLRITRAKAECATCPVRLECLRRGTGQHGIWGGLTDAEREPVCRDQAGTRVGLGRHRHARQAPCPACHTLTPTGRAEAREDDTA